MRLIDADLLLKNFKHHCRRNCNKCVYSTFLASDEHCGIIDDQPTAYDPENVMQQLEEMKPDIECFDNEEDYEYARNRHHKYVQIVRNGGVK